MTPPNVESKCRTPIWWQLVYNWIRNFHWLVHKSCSQIETLFAYYRHFGICLMHHTRSGTFQTNSVPLFFVHRLKNCLTVHALKLLQDRGRELVNRFLEERCWMLNDYCGLLLKRIFCTEKCTLLNQVQTEDFINFVALIISGRF